MDSPVSSARGILLVRSLKKIGRRESIIGSYGGEFYVLLVVYVTMRFDHSHCNGHCRKNDVEALPKTYKQHVRIQNNSFNEKYGYMEICS